ncbi:substrate-binding periplasmic protein [Cerasicoccus arenae]|uniref:substrate-binding periplasmic protein n=1 Tax=Cerasicoccus arenae TaxID=424488 RepID=UPI00366F56EA
MLSLMLASFGLSGCANSGAKGSSNSADEMAASANVLRVGTSANMPPFVFKQGGELVGLEIDLAKQLAKGMNRELRIVEMDFEDLIPALQNNRVDIIMAGMNYTQERAAIIAMTTPYMQSGQMALVLRKNASKYGLPGLIGNTRVKVGAEAGTTGEYLVQSSFPNAKLVTYSSAEAGAQAVADGDVELLIHDAPTIYWLAGTYQNRGVTPARPVLTLDQMVWGVNRDNQMFVNQINALVTTWASNGELNRIVRRWISL